MNEANESGSRLIEIFNQARLHAEGKERDAYLAEACVGDAPLRAEVEDLLREGNAAGGFLDVGEGVSKQLEAEFAKLKPEEAGDQIGPYKLREQIGEGGFGTVWVAEQELPV